MCIETTSICIETTLYRNDRIPNIHIHGDVNPESTNNEDDGSHTHISGISIILRNVNIFFLFTFHCSKL